MTRRHWLLTRGTRRSVVWYVRWLDQWLARAAYVPVYVLAILALVAWL